MSAAKESGFARARSALSLRPLAGCPTSLPLEWRDEWNLHWLRYFCHKTRSTLNWTTHHHHLARARRRLARHRSRYSRSRRRTQTHSPPPLQCSLPLADNHLCLQPPQLCTAQLIANPSLELHLISYRTLALPSTTNQSLTRLQQQPPCITIQHSTRSHARPAPHFAPIPR